LNLRWPCPICKKEFLAWPAQIRNHYLRCKTAARRNASSNQNASTFEDDNDDNELPLESSSPESPNFLQEQENDEDDESSTYTAPPPLQMPSNGNSKASRTSFQFGSSLVSSAHKTPPQRINKIKIAARYNQGRTSVNNQLALLESADFEYDDFESVFHTDASIEEDSSYNNTAGEEQSSMFQEDNYSGDFETDDDEEDGTFESIDANEHQRGAIGRR